MIETLQTRRDVAAALGVKLQWLCNLLYNRRLRNAYVTFDIPKRNGGTRTISAPPRQINWLQNQVVSLISKYYVPKSCVHGFVQGRSIVSNSRNHINRGLIVNVDLKNFFPTITIRRVRGLFRSHPFNFGDEAATTLAQICCRGDGVLPQGGPSSPLISNLICRRLDNDFLSMAKKHRLRYSRYADDLTFSTTRNSVSQELVDVSTGVAVPGSELTRIVAQNDFECNEKKCRVYGRNQLQEVTGLTVNDFPNVRRSFIRSIEGALYSWKTHGLEAAQLVFEEKHRKGRRGLKLDNVLRGQIAYLKMVRGEHDYIYRRLARTFNSLSLNAIRISKIGDALPCALHNVRRPWNEWTSRFRDQVFHLTVDTDLANGSTFHLGGGVIATARHNLVDQHGNARPNVQVKIGGMWKSVTIQNLDGDVRRLPDVAFMRQATSATIGRFPTQLRLPEIGEEVAAIGFPSIPLRDRTVVLHVGTVEALPVWYETKQRFIQVSFQSGGGLSGGPLVDASGHVLGIMVENVFMHGSSTHTEAAPSRAYGQAMPIEYLDEQLLLDECSATIDD